MRQKRSAKGKRARDADIAEEMALRVQQIPQPEELYRAVIVGAGIHASKVCLEPEDLWTPSQGRAQRQTGGGSFSGASSCHLRLGPGHRELRREHPAAVTRRAAPPWRQRSRSHSPRRGRTKIGPAHSEEDAEGKLAAERAAPIARDALRRG
eukprot:9473527-Pyramimonas_sp.AAC.1